MPYLSVELDARRKAAMIANGLGLHPGVVMWGLEELWEISWRTKTDTTTPVGLAGCFGPDVERMMPALLVHGFLEPLDGGTYRVRGASRYLRIRAAQSAAGHAAKGNLRRGRGAGTGERASPGGAGEAPGSVSGSAPALTASSEQRASNTSESTPLAGAVAPAGQSPPSAPSQAPTPPAKDAQAPAQAVLVPVPDRPAKKPKRAKAEAAPTSPHFRALSDRLVEGYRRATGHPYVFQGAKDGAAVGRLCGLITAALSVEDLGLRFEAALRARFGPATGIADFAGRPNDPRWGAPSTRAEDQQHNPVPGVFRG